MPSSDHRKLLADVLADPDYNAFKARVLKEGLVAMRARRPPLPWPQWLALAAAVSLLLVPTVLLFRGKTEGRIIPPSIEVVVSQPLLPAQIVHSAVSPSLTFDTASASSGRALEVVATSPQPLIELNDGELLALFGSKPVGILRRTDRAELLIFSN